MEKFSNTENAEQATFNELIHNRREWTVSTTKMLYNSHMHKANHCSHNIGSNSKSRSHTPPPHTTASAPVTERHNDLTVVREQQYLGQRVEKTTVGRTEYEGKKETMFIPFHWTKSGSLREMKAFLRQVAKLVRYSRQLKTSIFGSGSAY